jgi:hypothetical protein
MQILNFIKKLLPRIERSTISEDLRTTEKELSKVAIPSWASASEHFRIAKPKSNELQRFQLLFYQHFDLRRAVKSFSFVEDIARRLNNLLVNVTFLQSILEDEMEKDLITQGMTMRHAYILRSASNMSMVSRYLLSLLNYLYMVEAREREEVPNENLSIAKAEIAYVEKHFATFAQLFSQYAQDPETFRVTLENMPTALVSEKTRGVLQAMLAASSKDPLEEVGMAGFVGNPIYSVRLMIAQWQNERYESAKSKLKQLELRLAYLEMQEKGKNDPIVEREIAILQDRIEKLDYKIRETDHELGI